MTKRTTINDAILIEDGQDLERIVKDKRAQWRANNAKARRRQRRYKKKLIAELPRIITDIHSTYPEDEAQSTIIKDINYLQSLLESCA